MRITIYDEEGDILKEWYSIGVETNEDTATGYLPRVGEVFIGEGGTQHKVRKVFWDIDNRPGHLCVQIQTTKVAPAFHDKVF